MSYAVERWNGHWFSEGMRFETEAEAVTYAKVQPTETYRIASSVDKVNYQFVDGSLKPYKKKLDPALSTWGGMCIQNLLKFTGSLITKITPMAELAPIQSKTGKVWVRLPAQYGKMIAEWGRPVPESWVS